MLSILVGAILQTPTYYLLDETPGEPAPVAGGTIIYTIETRVIGRKAKIILDTKARALPFKLQYEDNPTSLLSFAIKGLGRKGERIVANPDNGTVAFVKVLEIKRV